MSDFVDGFGGVAADEGLDGGIGEGGGDVLAAQCADGIDGLLAEWIARDRDGQHGEIAGLVGLHLGAAVPRLAGQPPAQALDPGLDGRRVGVAVDHDLGRLGGLAGERGVQGDVPLLGGEPIRKRADAGLARAQSKHGHGHDQEDRRGEHETDHRPPEYPAHRARPERALFPLGGAPEDRQAQGVDAIPEQAQQGRQQRQGGGHRDQRGGDRAGGEAAHDRARDQQQPDHGQRERDPAEQHRAAGRGADRADRLPPLAPVMALLAKAREHEQ